MGCCCGANASSGKEEAGEQIRSQSTVEDVISDLPAETGQEEALDAKDTQPEDAEAQKASDLGWSKLSMGLTEDARDEFHGLVERRPSAQAFTSRGIANLLLGDHEAAIQDFSQAIELDRCCSEAYNNRGIAREIQGDEGALADYRRADELAKTPEQREKLMQVRKWKPFGWEKGRKEAKGETEAKNADFLISFASPDAHSNNEILHQLAKAVHFQGKLRPVTFCHDRSLGMGLHLADSEQIRRWAPEKFADLDERRAVGEFPAWFRHYKTAAEETKHGILILQLTEGYFKSKACRWEFGYVRKPELVHVYHQGVDGPRIVSWRELTQDVTLCSQVFGAGGAQDVRLEGHMDKVAQGVEETLERIQTFARTVEEQEYQAWCSMPLLEVAYSFSKAQFGEEHDKTVKSLHALSVVYQKTGSAERAGELAAELLKFLEANASDASLSKARDLGAKPELMKLLEENVLAKSSGPGVTLVGGSVSSLHLNVAITLNNLSNAFEKSGAFARQKEILERALRITELHCGSDHWHVAAVLTNLGNAHGHLGDHKQKRDMLMKALKMKELHDGPDHREVGVTLVNLANAYGSLGDPRQQKELAERALKILEQQLGPEHPLVAASLQSLGDALGSLGDCAQQEEMLRRALRIKELQYGPEHPELVNILHHLGRVWRSLGDHGREKEFLLRSLKIRETLPESEKLAKILADLANAFESLKDYAREKEMLERAVEIQEKHGGSKDPELAKLLNNLGSTLGSLGEHIRQKETLERALRIFEQHCGPEHVNVAMTLANLSSAHGALEEHLQKKQVLQRALGIFQQQQHPLADRVRAMLADLDETSDEIYVLERELRSEEQEHGPSHVEVGKSLARLGTAYGSQESWDRARDAFQRAADILEAHGAEDALLVDCLLGLGIAFGYLGDGRKKEVLKKAVAVSERQHGAEDPEVASVLLFLSSALKDLGEHREWKEVVERALQIQQQHYGPRHPELVRTLRELASAHCHLKERRQQKDSLERALEIQEQHYGEDVEVGRLCADLGNLYGLLGDHCQQKDFLERAFQIFKQHLASDDPLLGQVLCDLCDAYYDLGDEYASSSNYEQQRLVLQLAVQIKQQLFGPKHLEVAQALACLSDAYRSLQDYTAQKEALERALPIFEEHYGAEHPEVAKALANLGIAHASLGGSRQKELWLRALKIFEQHDSQNAEALRSLLAETERAT